jgi:hypothetical protein
VAVSYAGVGPNPLCRSPLRHPTAFLRAAAARLGASLAMLHGMFFALGTTCLAHICAERANFTCELASAGHVPSRESAGRRAIDIESDAARHGLGVCFLQTSGRAVVASVRTSVAGFDAACVLGVGHSGLLDGKRSSTAKGRPLSLLAGSCGRGRSASQRTHLALVGVSSSCRRRTTGRARRASARFPVIAFR